MDVEEILLIGGVMDVKARYPEGDRTGNTKNLKCVYLGGTKLGLHQTGVTHQPAVSRLTRPVFPVPALMEDPCHREQATVVAAAYSVAHLGLDQLPSTYGSQGC